MTALLNTIVSHELEFLWPQQRVDQIDRQTHGHDRDPLQLPTDS